LKNSQQIYQVPKDTCFEDHDYLMLFLVLFPAEKGFGNEVRRLDRRVQNKKQTIDTGEERLCTN